MCPIAAAVEKTACFHCMRFFQVQFSHACHQWDVTSRLPLLRLKGDMWDCQVVRLSWHWWSPSWKSPSSFFLRNLKDIPGLEWSKIKHQTGLLHFFPPPSVLLFHLLLLLCSKMFAEATATDGWEHSFPSRSKPQPINCCEQLYVVTHFLPHGDHSEAVNPKALSAVN